jgi:hypothetical protein
MAAPAAPGLSAEDSAHLLDGMSQVGLRMAFYSGTVRHRRFQLSHAEAVEYVASVDEAVRLEHERLEAGAAPRRLTLGVVRSLLAAARGGKQGAGPLAGAGALASTGAPAGAGGHASLQDAAGSSLAADGAEAARPTAEAAEQPPLKNQCGASTGPRRVPVEERAGRRGR